MCSHHFSQVWFRIPSLLTQVFWLFLPVGGLPCCVSRKKSPLFLDWPSFGTEWNYRIAMKSIELLSISLWTALYQISPSLRVTTLSAMTSRASGSWTWREACSCWKTTAALEDGGTIHQHNILNGGTKYIHWNVVVPQYYKTYKTIYCWNMLTIKCFEWVVVIQRLASLEIRGLLAKRS